MVVICGKGGDVWKWVGFVLGVSACGGMVWCVVDVCGCVAGVWLLVVVCWNMYWQVLV